MSIVPQSFRTPQYVPSSSVGRRLGLTCALLLGLSVAGCQKAATESGVGRSDVKHALEVLEAAPAHGFAPGQFAEAKLRELSESHSAADLKARDRLLFTELVAYAKAQHGGTIPTRSFPADWGLKPEPYNAEAELRAAVQSGKFRDWLDHQAPESAQYQALQKAYVGYLKVMQSGGWPMLPAGELRPGSQGPAVQALRQRLAMEDGALPANGPAVYDGALAAAVQRFQQAHGLPTNGMVDKATLAELNVPAATRAAQIRANLERLRWLPREEPATRVDVNTAAATFDYVVNGQPQIHMLAASGKPGDETPMLASKISAIVLNPPWNVPQGIAEEELYPKQAADPGYFAAHGYQVVSDGSGSRVVQKPSADSALGLVKFDFKNPYAVYLHDTPSKAAFSRTSRAVSHGCVRLEHAVAFAKVLLSNEPGWSAAKVDEVLAGGETTNVALKHDVPVRLMYLTAFPEGGRIAFRPDVYGWDAKLLGMMDGAKTVAQTTGSARKG